MADQNPIKYSDLISPDSSITDLIRQLEDLDGVYKGVTDSIRKRAEKLGESLKMASGATEEGRETMKSATKEADRLAKAYEAMTFAESDNAKKLAEIKAATKEANDINKLMVKINNSLEGSYNRLSAQYSLNKIYLNNMTKEERENTEAGRQLVKETKAIYDEMNKLQQATGKYALNVGNYENSINAAIGAQSKWFKNLQSLGALFQGGFTNGVKAAGSAVAGFGKQLLALMANPIVATIAAVTAAFVALSKGITSSEENTQALSRVLAPFQRILTGVVSVLQTLAGWVLKALEGFEKMTMALSRQLERLPLVGNALKKVNDALEENIRLTQLKNSLEKQERTKNVANAKLARDVAMYKNLAASTSDAAQKQHYLNMARKGEQMILSNELKLAYADLKVKQKLAEQADNDAEANEALAQARVRVYNAERDYYQGTMRLEKQLATIRGKKDAGAGGGGGGRTTIDTTKQEAAELERLQREQEKRQLAAIREMEDAKAELIENQYDKERAKTFLRYDRQIEDLRAQMAALGDDEVEAKKAIDETIIALEQQKWNRLADIQEREMQAAYDAEQQYYDKLIKATDNLIKKQEDAKKAEERMQQEQLRARKEVISEAMSYALDSLNVFIDAMVRAAERQKELADAEVDRAKDVLDAEIEARNNGYANEVETARKELEMAKKNQQKALKEQQKAQQAQEALDTAQQVSSLITATANIWKTMTGTGPWGTALAIAATALMWGSFAAAKIKAHEVAGSGTEQYGEGTVELLQGGSHQSGNDIDLGRKKDGTRRRAEGGEYFAVINKRSSRRYRGLIPDVVNALNDGTFAEKYMGAYDGGGVNVEVSQRTDLGSLRDDVRLIREQGERQQYVDGNGNTVQTYKNLRIIIHR